MGSEKKVTIIMTTPEEAQPKFDKDLEILKVNLLSDFRNGFFFAWLTIYLAIILGLEIMWWQYMATMKNGLFSLAFNIGSALIVGFFLSIYLITIARPYLRHLRRLNDLVKQIERGERLKDLNDLMKQK